MTTHRINGPHKSPVTIKIQHYDENQYITNKLKKICFSFFNAKHLIMQKN